MKSTRTGAAASDAKVADLSSLSPASQALIMQVAELVGAAEARARLAEDAASAEAQRAKDAEDAAGVAREREAAARAALEEERRRHAEQLAAIAAARAALDGALDAALGAKGDGAEASPDNDVATVGDLDAMAQEIAVDADSEGVCAAMISTGEARDRREAIAILVAEAAAQRRGKAAGMTLAQAIPRPPS